MLWGSGCNSKSFQLKTGKLKSRSEGLWCAGVIAAAALKCMGGHIQGRLAPRNDDERTRALEAGYKLEQALVSSLFAAPSNNPF